MLLCSEGMFDRTSSLQDEDNTSDLHRNVSSFSCSRPLYSSPDLSMQSLFTALDFLLTLLFISHRNIHNIILNKVEAAPAS
jgi:hypothetical protein